MLNSRGLPLGLSAKLGARGRCLPRARPPSAGISYVADLQQYKARSYPSRRAHGPMHANPRKSLLL